MATFHLELDKRVKLKNDRYNLCVRLGMGNDNMYLKYVPLTVDQYEKVFKKKTMDKKSIDLRREANQFLGRCEDIFSGMKPFNKEKYRKQIYGNTDEKENIMADSLLLRDLLTRYLDSASNIKLHTRDMYNTSINSFEQYKPGISVLDITSSFLRDFEKDKREDGYSSATISCYMRQLRSVINHFINVDKVIPGDYQYPFGKKGGYIIRKTCNPKPVMTNEEIKEVADFKKFQTPEQEYARDIWLMLYRCNGMNYADLIRLKWSDIKGNYIFFTRTKTENTRRNYIRDIIVPVHPKLRNLIDKTGVKNGSPFILGILPKGYDETTLRSKKGWQLEKLNDGLKYISEQLELSVDLRLKTARDCYATTLKREGYSKDVIAEMLGHAPAMVTDHYLADMDLDRIWEVNKCLL